MAIESSRPISDSRLALLELEALLRRPQAAVAYPTQGLTETPTFASLGPLPGRLIAPTEPTERRRASRVFELFQRDRELEIPSEIPDPLGRGRRIDLRA